MAKAEEEKQFLTNARASKLWRTLRIASKSRMNLFDKIDDGNNLQALSKPAEDTENARDENAKETSGVRLDVPLAASLSHNGAVSPEPGGRTEVAG